uniref:phosphonate metabolism transcriptional regulator PhnF n=1 Tax=Brucella pseudintermedia TaxID=370111 RepID=UPI001AED17B9|nr:phosphonate metabolism transcriptional regulator PhnF [Brucella pseudintermedia]
MLKRSMSSLSQGKTQSVWFNLKSTLQREISVGRFAKDERLPSEGELADLFGVHRHTVRKAINALQMEGLLRVLHGSGTYINREFLEYQIGRRTRFTENIERQGLAAAAYLLESAEEPASAAIAQGLEISPGTPIVRLNLLRRVDEQPISLATHYLRAERFPGIAEEFVRYRSLSGALKSFGVQDYVRIDTMITARLPTKDEARLLEQAESVPVLELLGQNADLSGAIFLYSVTRMSAVRVQLRIQGDNSDGNAAQSL